MTSNSWKNHISINPEICHGRACIKGTRVMISVIIDNIAEGHTLDDIVENYPTITHDDIKAAIFYASAITREKVLPIKIEG